MRKGVRRAAVRTGAAVKGSLGEECIESVKSKDRVRVSEWKCNVFFPQIGSYEVCQEHVAAHTDLRLGMVNAERRQEPFEIKSVRPILKMGGVCSPYKHEIVCHAWSILQK